MVRYFFISLIIIFLVSCSTQKKLNKSYTGKPISALTKEYGNLSAIIERKNDSVYIYERSEKLRSTEISQGRLTLDPIITPEVVKTERFFFTVKNGIITGVTTEDEYNR